MLGKRVSRPEDEQPPICGVVVWVYAVAWLIIFTLLCALMAGGAYYLFTH